MKKFTHHLYFWVLVGIFTGALIGFLNPSFAVSLKPLGEAFIALIKVFIAPIIFCTVVIGIAQAENMKKVGRMSLKTLVYFEVISTLALIIGLIVANGLKPGSGFNVDINTLDTSHTAQYAQKAVDQSIQKVILNIIPKTFMDAFSSNGDLLQVLFLAVLFGWALNHTGESGRLVFQWIEILSKILFKMLNAIMHLAPLGAGGAMAFTIGQYGVDSLRPLLALMGAFYLTCLLFIFGVLGIVAWFCRFNIFRFLRYIKHELFLVLGTSSSESALVPLMEKLERIGCPKSVIGIVVPTGYSFNLDGTNIYLTMAALFIAQALNIDLSLSQELSILFVAMLTSKGASGVTGAGFVTLAATLSVVPDIPVAGLALILGVDRFMSEARAITNFIGNGVATIVISHWEKELDHKKLQTELQNKV